MPLTPSQPHSPLPGGLLRSRILQFGVVGLGVVGLGVSGCSGDSSVPDPTAASTPSRVSPSTAQTPAASDPGAANTTLGPVRIAVPSALTAVENPSPPVGQRVAVFRSTPDPTGQAAVLTVTIVDQPGGRTAQSEAQGLAALKRDVHKATGVSLASVSLTGFTSAYAVRYDDRPAAGAAAGLRGLVVVGSLASGAVVTVVAKAPPELFAATRLEAAVGSLAASA